MKILVCILFILLNFNAFSQSRSECEKILSKEVNMDSYNVENMSTFLEEFALLKHCGLDDGDIEFFSNGPALGTLIIGISNNLETDSIFTFRHLYNNILEMKKFPQYEKSKLALQVSNELGKRPADINNWKKDKILLEKLELSNELIDQFHHYLKENSDPSKTYQEVFANFREKQNSEEIKRSLNNNPDENIYRNAGNVNFDELLEKSIESDKPLLLYFTGYAVVNARKIESNLLSYPDIQQKLKSDFYFVNLYVDDRTNLPENEQYKSSYSKKMIKTVGQKNQELQQSKFNTNTQPYFVIIDGNGKILKKQGYTNDIQVLREFLTIE